MSHAVNTWAPPEPLHFTKGGEEWPKWIRRFERYRVISGLEKKAEIEQVNALVYCLGEQAEDVFLALSLSNEQRDSYSDVRDAFEAYFIVKRNIIFERAMFNSRHQQEDENIDEFIASLYSLAEYCDYGDLKSDLIRDRLVVGIRDVKLSEKMQLISDLTLEKASVMAKQSEQVKKQNPQIHNVKENESKTTIDRIQTRQRRKQDFFRRKCENVEDKGQPARSDKDSNAGNCQKCGYESHSNKECPANHMTCYNCHQPGHLSRMCRRRNNPGARRIESEQVDNSSDTFVGTVNEICPTNTARNKHGWGVSFDISHVRLSGKIDTGADVTCISTDTYRNFFAEKRLRPPERRLYNADHQLLRSPGFFWEQSSYRGKSCLTEVYVIEGLERTLFDGYTCEALGIIKRTDIQSVAQDKNPVMSFSPREDFPHLFDGLGSVEIPYTIRLREGAHPYAITTPRRVPLPLMDEIKDNIDNMVKLGVIEAVEEPTDWCAGLVLVPKPNGKIRMCVDYVNLNRYVLREVHPMPVTETVLGQLNGAKYFSKIDANHGFWQCVLDPASQLLTTFLTPFGRYKFKRLPFGISAAPEFFQKRMTQILEGLPGVCVNIDDLLVYGETMKEHDERLLAVLRRLEAASITLNAEKCVFGVTRIRFLGHIVDAEGIHIDGERVEAVREMDSPQNISELRSLLGSIMYMSSFLPHLSTITRPLNDLLSPRTPFEWDQQHETAFQTIKDLLISAPVLAWYDPSRPTTISADASSYGVGAVITQIQPDGSSRPVAFASKTLSPYQRNWAQIEKEGYALVWACERFRNFITGITVTLETDHKPLISIFSTKPLDELSPKLQRMRLRLARYSYVMRHVPGKDLGTADLLSRRPLRCVEEDDLETEVRAYVRVIVDHIPASTQRIDEVRIQQTTDPVCQTLRKYIENGWPRRHEVDERLLDYWSHKADFSIEDGLLLKGIRLVVPAVLRQDILNKLHEGHLGITKCRWRAQQSVWWPGLSRQIAILVGNCGQCIQERQNRHEPLISSVLPSRPWQKLAMDLFYTNRKWYLLVTDFYSRYPEIARLDNLKVAEVVKHLKSIFSRHGTPEELVSDNGSHFAPLESSEFARFARDWGFQHITSSPRFPQSNGLAEATVKLVKNCLRRSDDGYIALQHYRATPLANGYSPAELLMGRKLRTTLPVSPNSLLPKLPDERQLRSREADLKAQQKLQYDRRHDVKPLPALNNGDRVWVTDLRRYGIVKNSTGHPRSYIVDTPQRPVRRNRFHLIPVGSNADEEEKAKPDETSQSEKHTERGDANNITPQQTSVPETVRGGRNTRDNHQPCLTPVPAGAHREVITRSGRLSKPPNRMNL